MYNNKDTWVDLKDIGISKEYKKTYEFDGEFINDSHKKISECSGGNNGISQCIIFNEIPGWIQKK